MTVHRLSSLGLLVGLATASPVALAASASRPNVIFILADDLGWGDLSCYGNDTIRTTHLDQLAKQGTLFTQFYVDAPVCSPSRAAFMTGRYPGRNGVHDYFATPEKNTARGMPQFLDPHVPNIANILHQAGYATAHVGKWHLSTETPDTPPISAYGFDYVGSGEGIGADVDLKDPYYRANSSARFVDEALDFIQRTGDQPFFVQLWLLLPHATLNPTPEQMAPFARFSNPHITHRSATTIYYACVDEVDRQVGRLLEELDRRGLTDNTLIVFSSDNGPEDNHIRNAGHSGIGSPGPFRGRKRSLYDGGIRLPFIVRFPRHIPAGRIDDTSIVAGVDLLPTVCRYAGVNLPQGFVPDGEDVSDILAGQPRNRHAPLFWEARYNTIGPVVNQNPQLAMRDGDWSFLMNPDRSRIELYEIRRDPMQLQNVAEQHPDLVEQFATRLLAWEKTLPPGPVPPGTGHADYPWPGREPAPTAVSGNPTASVVIDD